MTEQVVTHHRVDTASKLLGLALIAAGLEVGPLSAAGLLLVAAGIVSGTATVFTDNE
jgi:hypothetical protein